MELKYLNNSDLLKLEVEKIKVVFSNDRYHFISHEHFQDLKETIISKWRRGDLKINFIKKSNKKIKFLRCLKYLKQAVKIAY